MSVGSLVSLAMETCMDREGGARSQELKEQSCSFFGPKIWNEQCNQVIALNNESIVFQREGDFLATFGVNNTPFYMSFFGR